MPLSIINHSLILLIDIMSEVGHTILKSKVKFAPSCTKTSPSTSSFPPPLPPPHVLPSPTPPRPPPSLIDFPSIHCCSYPCLVSLHQTHPHKMAGLFHPLRVVCGCVVRVSGCGHSCKDRIWEWSVNKVSVSSLDYTVDWAIFSIKTFLLLVQQIMKIKHTKNKHTH